MPNKVDSNATELRFAEETTPGVLPGSPTWYPVEPNSFGEFGGELAQVARSTISRGRQRRKGTVVDQDATAGFQIDFTQRGLFRLLPGFLFADWRLKAEKAVTSISTGAYQMTASTGIVVGDLVFAENFATPANNGLKLVTAVSGTSVTVAGLVNGAETGTITKVGVQAGSGDLSIAVSSGVVSLNSTTLNLTTLGLIPGEWIRIGGSAVGEQFATGANNGFVRVKSIAANSIVLDRQPVAGGMSVDAGTGKTIRLFVGHVLKNETASNLIKTKPVQFERYFAQTGEYEYVKGCVPNTLELSISNASKVEVDLGYIATTTEETLAAKGGTRPATDPTGDVYNSSNDFGALRIMQEDTQASLTTYLTELNISINNNAEMAKAIAVLGAFDVTVGDFAVSGSATAYYSSNAAANAIRQNKDVSIDMLLAKNNVGWYFDIPLVTLGDGRRQVEKDRAVMLPLTMEAAGHPTLDHTLLVTYFKYIP